MRRLTIPIPDDEIRDLHIGDTVYLTASWVNITGFTVTGSDVGGIEAGIRLQDAHNCNVSWNKALFSKIKLRNIFWTIRTGSF